MWAIWRIETPTGGAPGPIDLAARREEVSISVLAGPTPRASPPLQTKGRLAQVRALFSGKNGMKRHLLSAVAAIAICAVTAHAQGPSRHEGRCVLRVDGKDYINGPCTIVRDPSGIEITGPPQARVRPHDNHKYSYGAQIDIAGGEVTGHWNGALAYNSYDFDLGSLGRDGDCWTNNRARVCAYDQ